MRRILAIWYKSTNNEGAEAMTGEIFFVAGLVFVLTLVGMAIGFGVLKLRGEGKEA
ncbi:cytochrome b6-f complex subunit PetM [Gloeobacter violaceus]|nr:PetM family cytochrome b6-f complex subunit 7 [Gloeobacter violaceus]